MVDPSKSGRPGAYHAKFLHHQFIRSHTSTVLHLLAIDPTYQRRSLGAMLMRPGLGAVDKAGKKAYIEASPMGIGLYVKFEWVVVDELVLDMGGVWGCKG